MDLMLNINIKNPDRQVNYRDPVLLTGSCFTEHIGDSLEELKFPVLQNPNGILFDPGSVCKSIVSYIRNHQYTEDDLFRLNETWKSWNHHSRFSKIDKKECLCSINASQQKAHDFLKKSEWLVITFGTAYSYRLNSNYSSHFPDKKHLEGTGVANCHKAPAHWFNKHLLGIDEIISLIDNCYHQLLHFNPNLKIIFTISPVRHIKDGVTENNRSKARLIEAVHHMVNKFDRLYYFPAYELVIDVLRDYRFYEADLSHPNNLATTFVFEKFAEAYIDTESRNLMEEIRNIITARKHRVFQPGTNAHKNFLQSYASKTKALAAEYPFLNMKEEMDYFTGP